MLCCAFFLLFLLTACSPLRARFLRRRRQSQGSARAGSRDKISRASERRAQQADLKCDKQGGRGREVNEARQAGGQNGRRNEENRFTPASDNENIPGDNDAGQRSGGGTNDDCQQPPDDVKGLIPTVCDGEGRESSEDEGEGQGSVARRDRVSRFAVNDREGRNQGDDAPLGDDAAGAGNESIQNPRESVPTIENGVCDSAVVDAVASGRIAASDGDDIRATPGSTVPRSSPRTDHLPDKDSGARESNGSMLASSPRPSPRLSPKLSPKLSPRLSPRAVEQGDTARQYPGESERIAHEECRSEWNHLLGQAAASSANNVERGENRDKTDVQDEPGRDIPGGSTGYEPREEQHARDDDADDKLNLPDNEEARHDTTAISQDAEDYISSESSGSSQEQNEIKEALSGRAGEGTGIKQLPPARTGSPRGSLYGGENRQQTPFRSIDENGLANGFATAARAGSQGRKIEGGRSSQFVSSGGSPRAGVVGSHASPINNGVVLRGKNGDTAARAELEHPRVNEKRVRLQDSGLGPSNGERDAMNVADRERGVNGNGAGGSHASDVGYIKSRVDRSKARLLEKLHEEVRQSESRRGLKRQGSVSDITLAQVIDHHMTRRRVNGSSSRDAVSSPQRRGSDCRNSSNNMCVKGKKPSPGSSSDVSPVANVPLPDGSGVVAAAWAHGDVLPLSAAAATHMRLVAPLMAGEPEGRRVVLRTAAAIAAGVAELYMHEYRLEVTGVCRDGLLLELYSSGMSGRRGYKVGRENMSALSAVSRRFQSAFVCIVSLNLEIGMLRVPHVEALESVPPGSSSREMLEWRNDGTSTIIRFEPASSDAGGRSAPHVTNGKRDVPSWHSEGPQLLGIHNDIGPLLPRTGSLESFNVDVFPVPPPPASETSTGVNQGHTPVIGHLALILSDSEVFNGGGGGSVCMDAMRSSHSGMDVSKLSARLGCVPPTRTVSGLTWRQVTGLTCVAAVNRLAYGPRSELKRKIRLAEGLHSAQVKIWFGLLLDAFFILIESDVFDTVLWSYIDLTVACYIIYYNVY